MDAAQRTSVFVLEEQGILMYVIHLVMCFVSQDRAVLHPPLVVQMKDVVMIHNQQHYPTLIVMPSALIWTIFLMAAALLNTATVEEMDKAGFKNATHLETYSASQQVNVQPLRIVRAKVAVTSHIDSSLQ